MANNERKILTTLALDGEAQFKKSMDAAYNSMKVLGSEMKLNTALFGDNAQSMEGLTKKGEILSKEVTQQKGIVAALSKAVEEAAKAYGESDSKTDAYRIKLNKATASLVDMEKSLKDNDNAMENYGKEATDADGKTEKLGKEIDTAGDKTNRWGDRLKALSGHLRDGLGAASRAAITGIVAVGAAALAAGVAIGRMVASSISSADEIQKTADVYGMTAERVQELEYAGKKLDVELDVITGAQTKLTRSMAAAKGGAGAQADAFKALKISVTDSNGKLKDSKTVMAEAFTALGKVGNETERDALAMAIFGKSAMELNPLIKAGGKELARLSDEAHKAGAVLSNEAIAGLDAFGDSADALMLSVKGIAGNIATALLPAMNGMLEFAQALIPELQNAIGTGDFAGLGTMIGDGITNMITGISLSAEKFMPFVTGMLTTIVGSIVSVAPTLIPALAESAMSLFQGILTAVTDNIEPISDMIVSVLGSMATFVGDNLPIVLDAGMRIITSILAGIASDPAALSDGIASTINAIITTITNNLPLVIDSGLKILLAVVGGIINGIPTLIRNIPQIISTIVATLQNNWPSIKAAGAKMIEALWEGIKSMGSWVARMIGDMFADIFNDLGANIGVDSSGRYVDRSKKGGYGPGFASGLDYVPANNYPAKLHEGEAVLTKIEAIRWREGQNAAQAGETKIIYLQPTINANALDYASIINAQYRSLELSARQLA